MGYAVQTPVFEGPFDLLLHLILKQEVDLWDVNLSTIIDQYLVATEQLGRIDLDVATEFLLIAATLIELKARRLLPSPEPIDLDEELARWEERDYLLARLLECKTFQDAARDINRRMAISAKVFPRTAGPEAPFSLLTPDPLEFVSLKQLWAAANKAFAPKIIPTVRTDHVHSATVSVREAVESILALLPARESISFRDLTRGVATTLEVIVRFLACLELFKQGLVDLEQIDNFDDLQVRALAPGEQAEIDLVSLAEWGDEDAAPALAEADREVAARAGGFA